MNVVTIAKPLPFALVGERPNLMVEDNPCRSDEWDRFAHRSGATYLCSHANLVGERLRGRRLRTLSVRLNGARIAQCAVACHRFVGRRKYRFVDNLQVLPEYADLWPDIMRSVINTIGAGSYSYGSEWSIEPPRREALALMPGVRVVSVASRIINAVDFSRWQDWHAYEKSISKNPKRSAAQARKADGKINVKVDFGLNAAVRHVIPLTQLRWRTNRRKGMYDVIRLLAGLRYLLRSTLMGNDAFTARVTIHGQTRAYFSGIRFGGKTYYMHGASKPDNNGASWFLILEMLRMAWNPGGKFLFGMYPEGKDWPGRENLLLSRSHCRATDFPNQIIEFNYRLDGAA